MSTEKDTFSQMIEKQLNEFEVPFNPEHWNEMSEKLDKIPKGKPGNTDLIKKSALIGSAAAILLAGYYFLNKEKSETQVTDQKETKIDLVEENNSPSNESEAAVIPSKSIDQTEETILEIAPSAKEESLDTETEKVEVDSKIEKYANHSEQSIKDEGKEIVDKIVDKQMLSFNESSPEIDNSELKTEVIIDSPTNCFGDEIKFSVNREIEGAEYYWNFGDNGLTSRKSKPIHKFKKPGTYTVTLLVSKGEKNDYKAEKSIVIKEKPKATVISINNQITLSDPYAQFECVCSDDVDISWTFNEKQRAKGKVVDFLVPEKGSFNVHLIASNKAGCNTEVDYLYQAFKGVKMDVENAITPNNDGENDVFIPKELVISDVDFSFTILEPSGRMIFESKDKYVPWNGKINNTGNDLPIGIYLWKVTFTDNRGKLHKQEGAIKLIR